MPESPMDVDLNAASIGAESDEDEFFDIEDDNDRLTTQYEQVQYSSVEQELGD